MKKIIGMALVACALAVSLCGCNMSMGMGSYRFTKVHVSTNNHEGCLSVIKWYDSEGSGVEVLTEEVGAMFLSENTYILLEGKCPFCD